MPTFTKGCIGDNIIKWGTFIQKCKVLGWSYISLLQLCMLRIQNLKTPAIEYLENGNYHVYREVFHQINIFFKWIPIMSENCKTQQITPLKKINRAVELCALATNNKADLPLTLISLSILS